VSDLFRQERWRQTLLKERQPTVTVSRASKSGGSPVITLSLSLSLSLSSPTSSLSPTSTPASAAVSFFYSWTPPVASVASHRLHSNSSLLSLIPHVHLSTRPRTHFSLYGIFKPLPTNTQTHKCYISCFRFYLVRMFVRNGWREYPLQYLKV
jgi:hypothetical protein